MYLSIFCAVIIILVSSIGVPGVKVQKLIPRRGQSVFADLIATGRSSNPFQLTSLHSAYLSHVNSRINH